MAITTANILLGSGTFSWYGLNITGTPSTGWHDVGGFRDGVTMAFEEDQVLVEGQAGGAVKALRGRMGITVTTNLLESTLDSLMVSLYGSGTNTDVVTAGTSIEFLVADPVPVPIKFVAASSIGADGLTTYNFSSAVPQLGQDVSYTKDAETIFPVTFTCLAIASGSNWGFGKVTDT